MSPLAEVEVVGTHRLFKVGNTNNNQWNRGDKNKNTKVIWFNLPFCKLTITNINIRKYFLNVLDRHFDRDNPLSKIINRNTVKITYSCTNNMHSILITIGGYKTN